VTKKTVPHTVNGETHNQLRLGEHEILLSFRDDLGAEAFYDYWLTEGRKVFDQWCEDQNATEGYYESVTPPYTLALHEVEDK